MAHKDLTPEQNAQTEAYGGIEFKSADIALPFSPGTRAKLVERSVTSAYHNGETRVLGVVMGDDAILVDDEGWEVVTFDVDCERRADASGSILCRTGRRYDPFLETIETVYGRGVELVGPNSEFMPQWRRNQLPNHRSSAADYEVMSPRELTDEECQRVRGGVTYEALSAEYASTGPGGRAPLAQMRGMPKMFDSVDAAKAAGLMHGWTIGEGVEPGSMCRVNHRERTITRIGDQTGTWTMGRESEPMMVIVWMFGAAIVLAVIALILAIPHLV